MTPVGLPRRMLVWTLGLGAFGLAFSITTTAAYLPPILGRFTNSRTLIAAVLGVVLAVWAALGGRFGHVAG